VVAILAGCWALLLAWGERGVFSFGVVCVSRGGGGGSAGGKAHVVLVADPQLTDTYSYGQSEESLILALTQRYSDLYMARAFRHSVPAALRGATASAIL
jgi:hypothetical protein